MTEAQKSYFLSRAIPFEGVAPFKQLQALPPVGRIAQRLCEIADYYGLVLAPQWYTAVVGKEQQGFSIVKLEVSQDAAEGPFFITALHSPGGLDSGRDVEILVQSGSRKLTEGRLKASDLFTLSQVIGAEAMPAPIVVLRGDSLILSLRRPGAATFASTDGVVLQGFVFRSRNGERLGAIVDEIAALVRGEGEFYAAGVVSDRTNDAVNVSSTMLVHHLVVAADSSRPGLAERAVGIGCALGNYFPFPAQGSEQAGLDVDALASVALFQGAMVLQSDIRYPLRAGSRVVLYQRYAGIEPGRTEGRIAIVGRRETIS